MRSKEELELKYEQQRAVGDDKQHMSAANISFISGSELESRGSFKKALDHYKVGIGHIARHVETLKDYSEPSRSQFLSSTKSYAEGLIKKAVMVSLETEGLDIENLSRQK